MSKDIVCLNGQFVPAPEAVIPVDDRGVLYGMGIFETIRVAGGKPSLIGRHLSRLFASAAALGLEITFSREELSRMLRATAAENGLDQGGLRLTLTAGGESGGPLIIIAARPLPYRREQYLNGIRAGFSTVRRNEQSPLIGHKTLNYFENMLARRQAVDAGWDEAFLANTSGNLAEGAVSNIFLVGRGKVITPHPRCGLLPGITRGLVIELCARLGLPLEEREVAPEEIYRAGECLVTNSLLGVMPVTAVGGTDIGGGRPGEVTKRIMAAINES